MGNKVGENVFMNAALHNPPRDVKAYRRGFRPKGSGNATLVQERPSIEGGRDADDPACLSPIGVS